MQQLLPAPRTPRELIELFATYEGQNGISSVLNAADFSVLDRATVLKMALGVVGQRRSAAVTTHSSGKVRDKSGPTPWIRP